MAPTTRSHKSLPAEKPSPQAMFMEIVQKISTATQPTELLYDKIEREEGELLYQSLATQKDVEQRSARLTYNAFLKILRIEVMPTRLHDAHQRWAINASQNWARDGTLNSQESEILNMGVSTTFDGFTGVYQGSAKEPDFFFQIDSNDFPSIVIESGWSESFSHLRADKDLWIMGNNSVTMVILLKWSRMSGGKVRGQAEVWQRNAGGTILSNETSIFPEPSATSPDRIQFTKRQLFGSAMLPGQDPDSVLSLEMNMLRQIAEEVITRKLGLVPA
ncbi:hypothetical protein ASPZODRAFT_132600 [Penicilliopsis zonata CBS 506.65]|uniref:Uncharacterized protein n=1 Tax=Penicilliopsis zonata CBS 506.65 TaxID=1073090 RepID=A0A1L9SGZ7_9EURO|nr:hypothetical protein ASPZODRAFT_132600 [Penicilliopsis zonata CBS 506.65]OJJ46530.1 hypothetical protein ASPZODRAFT_132600 [Penicilliopsis zonata CBS 506.65]